MGVGEGVRGVRVATELVERVVNPRTVDGELGGPRQHGDCPVERRPGGGVHVPVGREVGETDSRVAGDRGEHGRRVCVSPGGDGRRTAVTTV